MTRVLIAAVLALAACKSKSAKTDEPAPVGARTDAAGPTGPTADAQQFQSGPAPDARPAADAGASDATATAPKPAGPIPADARVLVTSVASGWDVVATDLALYTRPDAATAWQPVRTWKGTLGNTGLAWGKGLHGNGPPPDQEGPLKLEGDGKSPAGVFVLDASYGYAAAPPTNSALPYTQVDKTWRCVDDPDSKVYNQIVDADLVTKDWKSAEDMKRKDALYTWVINVGHNPARMPGEGSCIFLHVWRGPTDGTVGCTAMAKSDIEALLADLDPAEHPVLVQLTAPVYDTFAEPWQLPARAVAAQ